VKRVLATVVIAACGAAAGPSTPAADGVRGYVNALRADDPHAAYAMLADDVRQKLSFEEFSIAWKQSAAERHWQANALEDSLKSNPYLNVGERALVSYPDGKLVALVREAKDQWHLESELVSRSRAQQPRDALRIFADAVAARDVNGALDVLTARRREGLTKQVQGFLSGLARHVNDPLDPFGKDRFELRWDENGIRYRIVLLRENDEWRVDDIYIRPAPKTEDDRENEPAPFPEE